MRHMSSRHAHHNWWWVTEAQSQSAAYVQALAAGAKAAQERRLMPDSPYRQQGTVEERRLLACWNWGWSRVALFGESLEAASLGPLPILPSSAASDPSEDLRAEEMTPLAHWGLPDSSGRFLVRVIHFEHYEFAEDLSGAGNMLLAAVHNAVKQLHPGVDYRTIGQHIESTETASPNVLTVRLPDGTLLASSAYGGYSTNPRREVREPTVGELAAWSGLPTPPPPPPPPPTPVEILLRRLDHHKGEAFHTKRGVQFTYGQHRATLFIKNYGGRGGTIDVWELRRALAEWPVPGPSALSAPAATRGYVWALLADDRVLGLAGSEGDLLGG